MGFLWVENQIHHDGPSGNRPSPHSYRGLAGRGCKHIKLPPKLRDRHERPRLPELMLEAAAIAAMGISRNAEVMAAAALAGARPPRANPDDEPLAKSNGWNNTSFTRSNAWLTGVRTLISDGTAERGCVRTHGWVERALLTLVLLSEAATAGAERGVHAASTHKTPAGSGVVGARAKHEW